MSNPTGTPAVPAATVIGHVHLCVSDLDRSLGFYMEVLGFELTARLPSGAAFLSAGGYHHHIAINTWQSLGATPPPPGHTGLYHFAIRYPGRHELAVAVRRVLEAGVRLQGAADHGISESIYLADPDGIGVELTRDRPEEDWPRDADGHLDLGASRPLDLKRLLAEA